MRRGVPSGLILLGILAGNPAIAASGPSYAPAPDPVLTMARLAAEPYRYGGALSGSMGEQAPASGLPDRPPAHISVGLGAPAPDGRIRGEAILFTADRHLIASSDVDGELHGGGTPGTGACTLHMTLRTQRVTLAGLCTADTLSGEIVSIPSHVDLLTRVVTWWGDRAVSGRYWLTPASFDPASP